MRSICRSQNTIDNIRDVILELKSKYQIYDKPYYISDDQDRHELDDYEDYVSSAEYKTNLKLYKDALRRIRDINKTRVSWSNTRLILSYLCSPDIIHDYTKMINRAVTTKDFSLYADYLVSKIVPKEKELKIKYRGYGCLTPLARHKNLIQEKNTKKFMEEYCDEQGSTLSELSLIKKLYALSNLKEAYQGYKCLCINVDDASGWNKRFRSQTVNPIMENSLDKIFNYPIFTTTHEMYTKMLFYTSDDIYTMWWEGHEGGVEGQNTDTWLYCYIQQIKINIRSLIIY